MSYIFERPEFSKWSVSIKRGSSENIDNDQHFNQTGDFEEFSGVFRTGFRNGKECEIFTLLDKKVDFSYLWVNIFKNGSIEYVSHIPSVMNVDRKSNRIEISLLVYCQFNNKNNHLKLSYLDEYKANFKVAIDA